MLLLAGCKSGKRFELAACQGAFSLPRALVPAFDYAELRDTEAPGKVLEAAGEKCARASDRQACEERLAAKTSKAGWSNGSNGRRPGHHYLVATRGNDVFLIDGEMIKLEVALAPVDSPVKAAAIAATQRSITPACEGSVRQVEGGFEVHLTTDSCFGPADEVIKVSTDGSTTVISSDHKPPTCVG